MKGSGIPRIETGVRNLDAILHGGFPKGSITVVSGPPGSGKTTFAQQFCFYNATVERPALYFNTLSEPGAKTLLYLQQFTFFDPKKIGTEVQFVDLGEIMRKKGLEEAASLVMSHVKNIKPSIVVIDSFKVFDDLAKSKEELRKFGYEIAVGLMAWETTGLLLGEYSVAEYQTNPLFSIVDGLLTISHRESSGEQQRFFQVYKMRGTEHSMDEYPFVITRNGVEVFAPRVTIQRQASADVVKKGKRQRCKTNISKLDELLADGIPWGSSLLIGGVAGTGKTLLSLEFIYRGALAGEKGIVFSFEETDERLRANARALGWDLDGQIESGMVKMVFIPQPNIMVEAHLLMMREEVESFAAKRVAVDSVSVFLHKIKDAQVSREKIFQLASIVQNANAVGFFATDIPYGSDQISRYGVEETVVDGVILLTSTEEDLERQRYLEVYKLRNTAHLKGRHNMIIGPGGIAIFPRYNADLKLENSPPPVGSQRLFTGIAGLDSMLGGGVLARSVTLVSGSTGIGKSTLAMQFVLEGAKHREPGMFVTLEEGPKQMLNNASALGLPLKIAIERGRTEVLYLSREHVRANQFLTILTDRIKHRKVTRLVLDSVSDDLSPDALRQLLYNLIVRFKALGVTSMITIESESLYSNDFVTKRGLSPIADNLIMLRYAEVGRELKSSITVVKTRGSSHDQNVRFFSIGKGGMKVEHAETKTARLHRDAPVRKGVKAKR